ncbi:hypothetical protein Nmel_018027 [Mimus melanotis]
MGSGEQARSAAENQSPSRALLLPLLGHKSESYLPLLLLDDGQAATILGNRSLEHVIRSWRIAPSDSASELEAKAREKNNLPS